MTDKDAENIHILERTDYTTGKLLELTNPHKEIEFTDYVSVSGLLELARQYSTMPESIKELSASGIKESISQILEKHSRLLNYKEQIPIKELKNLLRCMYLVKKIKNDKYHTQLFEILSSCNTCIGILRSIKYITKNGIGDEKNEKLYEVLDDLIFLLIEFLDYRGHSISLIHRSCKQMISNSPSSLNSLDQIIDYLRRIGTKEINTLDTVKCTLSISFPKILENSIINFCDRLFYSLLEEKKISTLSIQNSQSTNDLVNKLDINYGVFNIDENYVDRINKFLYSQITSFKRRTKPFFFNVKIYRKGIKTSSLLVEPNGKLRTDPLKVKHFDTFWEVSDFQTLNSDLYSEIFRLNDWVDLIDNSSEQKASFNLLWSTMEFLLIDSVHVDKIKSISINFVPYMGLFYFRKVLKTFFKKLVGYYHKDQRVSQEFLVDWITKSVDKVNLRYDTVADAFCLFIFHKSFRNKWWDDCTFQNVSSSFLTIQTKKLCDQLINPSPALESFEKVLDNDLKQIYRLRNMITHSGITDSKILDNTYDRLKYYVETLINAISYSWIYQSNQFSTVFDLSDLKRVDWADYRDMAKSIGKRPSNILDLVNFRGLTLMPPNRFSFLSELEKD
ncbi:hypothetical protein ABGV40_09200 [Paenibacillus amylolyticus]|uniref:hypothetical protein n=1 Tax=Paenibacillus amylolyticus TaxID=1451 RepID=UPI0032420B70